MTWNRDTTTLRLLGWTTWHPSIRHNGRHYFKHHELKNTLGEVICVVYNDPVTGAILEVWND